MILVLILLYLLPLCHAISINSPCNSIHSRYQNDISIRRKTGRQKRAATFIKESLWPNGIVPYSISPDFTREVYQHIETAIEIWQATTCIRFIALTNESYGLRFEPQDCGCCSFVGRQQFSNGKPQEISINGQDCEDIGHMLHEIGHALGFWHEHVRPDRDHYVRLKEDNIEDTSFHNFLKKNSSEINSLGEKYDYDSIMHYSAHSFSVNKYKKTIIPRKRYTSIGQREDLSVGDIRQANKLYGCAEDENQCENHNGGCQHNCIDLYRGYKCKCRKGFMLDADRHSCVLACNRWHDEHEGLVHSPNYPLNYIAGSSCMWDLHAPAGHHIKIKILNFHLEESNHCSFDVLNIKSMKNHQWKDIATMCGKQEEKVFNIKSNNVRLLFRSDYTVQRQGFKLFYKFMPTLCLVRPRKCHLQRSREVVTYNNRVVTNSGYNCDREYFSSSGVIQYPDVRPANCIVKIKVHGRRNIVLKINEMTLGVSRQCKNEYLTIRKGNSLKIVSHLCGVMQNIVISTKSRFLWINFKTNDPLSKLVMTYTSVKDHG